MKDYTLRSTTFEDSPDPTKPCQRACCEHKPATIMFRWRFKGGYPPYDERWLYVCTECHKDMLEQEIDNA